MPRILQGPACAGGAFTRAQHPHHFADLGDWPWRSLCSFGTVRPCCVSTRTLSAAGLAVTAGDRRHVALMATAYQHYHDDTEDETETWLHCFVMLQAGGEPRLGPDALVVLGSG